MLKKRIKKYAKDLNSDSSGLNCTTYDLTGNGTDKKSNCVGIGMPTGLNNNNSDENLAVVVIEEEKLSKLTAKGKSDFTPFFLQLCVKNFCFHSHFQQTSKLSAIEL